MKRVLAVLSLCLVALLVLGLSHPAAADSRSGAVQLILLSQAEIPGGYAVHVRGTGLPAAVAVYKDESGYLIKYGETQYSQVNDIGKYVNMTDMTGAFEFYGTYFGYGSLTLTFYDQYGDAGSITLNLGLPTNFIQPTVAPVPTAAIQIPTSFYCPNMPASNLVLGMMVESLKKPSLQMMMVPPGWGPNPDPRRFGPGTQFRIRKGPLCVGGNEWWQADYRFLTHDPQTGEVDGESQQLLWFAEFTNGQPNVIWVTGSAIVPQALPVLSTTRAELVSSLKDNSPKKGIFLLVHELPSIRSSTIGSIQVRDGAYPIVGTNVNGTWLEIQMRSGVPGWVCTHLTENNAAFFTIPITSNMNRPCF